MHSCHMFKQFLFPWFDDCHQRNWPPYFLCTSLSVTWSCQLILKSHLLQRFSNARIRFSSDLLIVHVSAAYNSTENTHVLSSWTFISSLILLLSSQMVFKSLYAPVASCILLLMFSGLSLFHVTFTPRYTKLCTSSITLPFDLICSVPLVSFLQNMKVLVFFKGAFYEIVQG